MSDVVVVGSGVAGISCALTLLENNLSVTMITKARASDSATWYAQGGVASAMFDDDSADSHYDDTIVAGVGLCNSEAVRVLVDEGAQAVERLISRGAQFDRLADGKFARTREGGHHNSRIIHAGGDKTGEEIERALVKKAENVPIDDLKIIEHHMATKLIVENNVCIGIEFSDSDGFIHEMMCDSVVLATGGAGQLFATTTNPVLATADGLALGLNAGALCADLEFMQFHPTALHVPLMPRPLISEAVRGEGAILRDEKGVAFMQGRHELADLAPRDIVSREIAKVLAKNNIEYVYLDATMIENFAGRFPTIFAACAAAGLDPEKDFLPVSPAAHYYCGGIVTDLDGVTSIDGLYAAGEVACTGIHGANRLASNSLLEGLVYGERVAQAIISGNKSFEASGVFSELEFISKHNEESQENIPTVAVNSDDEVVDARNTIQKVMTNYVGVVRSKESIEHAKKELNQYGINFDKNIAPEDSAFARYELEHILTVARALVIAADLREESRGCHAREDFQDTEDEFMGRVIFTGKSKAKFFRFKDSI